MNLATEHCASPVELVDPYVSRPCFNLHRQGLLLSSIVLSAPFLQDEWIAEWTVLCFSSFGLVIHAHVGHQQKAASNTSRCQGIRIMDRGQLGPMNRHVQTRNNVHVVRNFAATLTEFSCVVVSILRTRLRSLSPSAELDCESIFQKQFFLPGQVLI